MITGVFSIRLGKWDAPRTPATRSKSVANLTRRRDTRPSFLLGEFVGDTNDALVRGVANALALGETQYNPLVLYGPSGVGKSLVATLLADHWRQGHPDRRVVWSTAQEWSLAFRHALDTDSIAEFRQRYCQAGCWIIDQFDTLANQPATQQQFRTILDQCLAAGCQVIVASQAAPWELTKLDASLASRLQGGLVMPLQPPGPAARSALLSELARRHQPVVPAELVTLLDERLRQDSTVRPTVPDLHEMIGRLATTWQRSSGSTAASPDNRTSVASIDEVLERLTQPHVGLKEIAAAVARYFGVPVSQLKGPTRKQKVVRARGVAIYLGRQLGSESLERLGQHFGGRDHTTALHAVRKTEELMAEDPALQQAVDDLTQELTTSASQSNCGKPVGLVSTSVRNRTNSRGETQTSDR